jgi:hypothetical protein
MGEHALLSASASHKWLHCPPSARLEEKFPDSTSESAREGTLAHEMAELKVRKAFIEPIGARSFNTKMKKFQEHDLYKEEMLRHTDTYLDYISSIIHQYSNPPYIAVEKKIDYSMYAPEGFGTADCIIIAGNTLYVIDFKYGKGVPVSAYENPQMMLYALGAYAQSSFLFKIENIVMVIVQPRNGGISEYEMLTHKLLEWGETIKPIAQAAFKGEGECTPGEYCDKNFCRVKNCRARTEYNLKLGKYTQMKPPLISNEEVGEILFKARDLAAWVKNLEEYALSEVLAGNDISGWKAVHGRSSRQFTDQDAVFKTLIDGGIDEAMLYERKPITLTKVEELLGKVKMKELLANYINMPPGKPALVVESDKREAIKPITAQEVFKVEGRNENE